MDHYRLFGASQCGHRRLCCAAHAHVGSATQLITKLLFLAPSPCFH